MNKQRLYEQITTSGKIDKFGGMKIFMDLPDKISDSVLGTLYQNQDEEGLYSGDIMLFNEIIPIELKVEPDEKDEYSEISFVNAHKALEWIKSRGNMLLNNAAEDLVYKYDQEDIKHPMWKEMFEKQLKKVLPLIKLIYIRFGPDEGYIIKFDDGGFYWGSIVTYFYNKPNEMDEFFVSDPDTI